jgi:uncharacterized protein HemX
VPSASAHRHQRPLARSAAIAACLALIGAGAAGCETTQEKAEKQQARATHILKERAKRQKHKNEARKKSSKHHEGGKSK